MFVITTIVITRTGGPRATANTLVRAQNRGKLGQIWGIQAGKRDDNRRDSARRNPRVRYNPYTIVKTVYEIELHQRQIRTAVNRLHRLPYYANHRTLGYDFCVRVLGIQHVTGELFNKRLRTQ